MKTILRSLIVAAALCTGSVRAQELNVGVHFNPTLVVPVIDGESTYDRQIKLYPVRVGYNIGVNAGFRYKLWSLETGLNIVQKSVEFKQKIQGTYNYYKIISNSTSFEIPLTVAYNVLQHHKNTDYDLYLLAGAGYELYSADGYKVRDVSQQGGSQSIIDNPFTIPQTNDEAHWVNIIAGAGIKTVIRRIGLIDYGLTLHVPLKTNAPYQISSVVRDYSTNTDYNYHADYHPRLCYVDIKLCYYFLNFDEGFKRKRYKNIQ